MVTIIIGYLFHLVFASWWHFAIAGGILVLSLAVFRRKWWLAFLLAYVYLLLAGTIFDRFVLKEPVIHLRPFWSYGIRWQRSNILLNLLMFIPIGFFGGMEWGKKIILWSALFSLAIEITQFFTWRGSCDVDDLIHNTISAILGYLLLLLARKLFPKLFCVPEKKEEKEDKL